ncbi:MAG: DegT/DnrJ/EryC1/StrS family aminotransferase, partial [Myxococcota bacterium]
MLGAMIPLARPQFGDAEVDAVAEVLRSGMLVSGPRVARFEAAVAERCGRAHGVAVSSGT